MENEAPFTSESEIGYWKLRCGIHVDL